MGWWLPACKSTSAPKVSPAWLARDEPLAQDWRNMTFGPFTTHQRSSWHQALLAWGALVVLAGSAASAAPMGEAVDFNRDVRRILSENCFKCHGPDAKERQ